MASVAAPYGAIPVGTLSASGSFTGKVRHYRIASGSATAIFYGDFVKLLTTGYIDKDTGTTTLTPIGIFVGCSYTDSNGQLRHNHRWPAATVAADAVAYVVDDPFVLFQMQSDETLALATIGANFAIVQTAGSASIGKSKNAVDGSTVHTTNTLPLRLVEFVQGPDSAVGDAYTDVICKFNVGHLHLNTTGLA
jgi:hypothetical protein